MPRRNIVGRPWPNGYNIMQHPQILQEKFDLLHVATRRNKVAKRTQHVAPNNVAICCFQMSRHNSLLHKKLAKRTRRQKKTTEPNMKQEEAMQCLSTSFYKLVQTSDTFLKKCSWKQLKPYKRIW